MWFDVDKDGLRKLLADRGPGVAVLELLQNAWDTQTRQVRVTLTPVAGRALVDVVVEDDDPDGFKTLSHAWTLFAESEKKGRVEQRGRFNLGEKLVLALCENATITSTTGRIDFDADGTRRVNPRRRRMAGSAFSGRLQMTREELAATLGLLHSTIPPVDTLVNGTRLDTPELVATLAATLPTVVADDAGVLRRTERMTQLTVYETRGIEAPRLYELGIPVCPLDGRWHVDVQQKVPLTLDRQQVSASYRKTVYVAVLNALNGRLTSGDATDPWVREAAGDPRAESDAVERVMGLRFGAERVAADPSDPEAIARATAAGYTVVHGGSLSAGEWANVKRADAVKPAGQVFPTPQPFHVDGAPLKMMPRAEWTPGMKRLVARLEWVGRQLVGEPVGIRIANERGWHFTACYGKGELTVNLARLGRAWFEEPTEARVYDLLVHELAHHFAPNHLSDDYHRACCRLAGALAELAVTQPARVRVRPRPAPPITAATVEAFVERGRAAQDAVDQLTGKVPLDD